MLHEHTFCKSMLLLTDKRFLLKTKLDNCVRETFTGGHKDQLLGSHTLDGFYGTLTNDFNWILLHFLHVLF